jgi:hypothetical protein
LILPRASGEHPHTLGSSLKRARLASALAFGVFLAGVSAHADPPTAASPPTKDDCIAANESAQDLQAAGKLREATGKLAVCIAASCPGPLRQDCTQRLADVEKAQPTLVLVAKDAAGKDVTAVRVTMDGHVLVESLNGTAIAVDPGEHRFFFEAPGLPLVEKSIAVRAGEKDRREFVVFSGTLPPAAAPAPAGNPAGPAPSSPAQTPPPAPEAQPAQAAPDGSTQRTVGLVLGGAGALGLIVGGVFGVMAKSTYDHALGTECGTTVGYSAAMTCNASGVQDVHASHDFATVSTVGFIGGLALLGGGAYVFFTAPKGSKVGVSPAVGPGSAALNVGGRW